MTNNKKTQHYIDTPITKTNYCKTYIETNVMY